MKPPFWMKLDGPHEDPMGEWYFVARVRWFAWPVFFLIGLKEYLRGSR